MRPTIQWLAVPALASGVVPVHAVTYLNIGQAQAAIFPGKQLTPADVKLTTEQRKAIEKASGVRVRNLDLKVWRVEGGGWFLLDEVIGKQEVVIKTLGEMFKNAPGIAGGAILGDGRVGLILDLDRLYKERTSGTED